jgi:hypothetical protein
VRRVVALLAFFALAAPAAAQNPDPVFVAAGTGLKAGADGRLQLRIVERAIGRIKIAVVRRGPAKEVAERIDRNVDVRGALLVVAGDDVHVITSYDPPQPAIMAVRRAFDGGGGLERKLDRSIDNLAEVDPGPSADVQEEAGDEVPLPSPFDDADEIVDDVTGTIKFVFLGVIGFIAAVFVLVAVVFWRRHRATGEATEEELADARADIERERGLLGQDIVELDAMTAFGGNARAAYERALDAYERSEPALARADSRRRLAAVQKLVADGRADAARARAGEQAG